LSFPVRHSSSLFLTADIGIVGNVAPAACTFNLSVGDQQLPLQGKSVSYADFWPSVTVNAGLTSADWTWSGSRLANLRVNCGSGAVATMPMTITVVSDATDDFLAGVSIENGDYATNDAQVTLNLSWKNTDYFDQVMLSNDGGFSASKRKIVDLMEDTVPWTLETQSSERLPKTVYIRFHDALTDTWTAAMTDDIILDTISPTISSASVDGVRAKKATLRISAKDNRTSVAQVMVSSAKTGGKRVVAKYSTKVTLNMSPSDVKFVRVQDGAGNWSEWRRL